MDMGRAAERAVEVVGIIAMRGPSTRFEGSVVDTNVLLKQFVGFLGVVARGAAAAEGVEFRVPQASREDAEEAARVLEQLFGPDIASVPEVVAAAAQALAIARGLEAVAGRRASEFLELVVAAVGRKILGIPFEAALPSREMEPQEN